jgi:hypothetical protein
LPDLFNSYDSGTLETGVLNRWKPVMRQQQVEQPQSPFEQYLQFCSPCCFGPSWFVVLAISAAYLLIGLDTANGQSLGHKLPGLIGLDAGRIPEPGLYLIDRAVAYDANQLRDRFGNVIPVGDLEFQALANAAGISYTKKFTNRSLSLSMTAAIPAARLRLNVFDRPEASFDRFGLADIYVQPARLGWRKGRVDVVGAYGIYIPTGKFFLVGDRGISQGQVTHELSGGGTVFADRERTAFITALASFELNHRKFNIDITRGSLFQIQGGAGISRLNRTLEVGIAGYALWQITDDSGGDLPPILRGVRDQVYGLGPEAAVAFKSIRSQLRVRYQWDLGVLARPKGNIFVISFSFVARRPQTTGVPMPD